MAFFAIFVCGGRVVCPWRLKTKFGAFERAREACACVQLGVDPPEGKNTPAERRLNALEWVFTNMCIWVYVYREAGRDARLDAYGCAWVYVGVFMCANMCVNVCINIEINGCK